MEAVKTTVVDKVVSYSNSRFFPWNILLEPLELNAIEHYMPLAIQAAWMKGSYKDMDRIQHLIGEDVKMVVNDYLLSPYSREAEEIHREFAADYPFAYTQALIFTRLFDTSRDLRLRDIIDIARIAELIGVDISSFNRREEQIKELISVYKKRMKKPRSFTKRIIDQKVVSADGEIIGVVRDIVFDLNTGDLIELLVAPRKGADQSIFKDIYEKKDYEGLIQKTIRGVLTFFRGLSGTGDDTMEYETYLAGISIENVHVSLYNDYVVFNR
ncbi:MAG: PRC-barrel domain-containing protein [Candidatus Syntropharchaeales archaeon]